jgi:CO dehydrogenase maturation factor
MKIAIAGKGGSGKTTISGLLARILCQQGEPVWAIDADSNPNLGLSLGIAPSRLPQLQVLPRSILEEATDSEGKKSLQLSLSPREVANQFGTPVSNGLTLMLMGTVDHAGAG